MPGKDTDPTPPPMWPKSLHDYRLEAESTTAQRMALVASIALASAAMTPRRYADVMRLVDTWFAEDSATEERS